MAGEGGGRSPPDEGSAPQGALHRADPSPLAPLPQGEMGNLSVRPAERHTKIKPVSRRAPRDERRRFVATCFQTAALQRDRNRLAAPRRVDDPHVDRLALVETRDAGGVERRDVDEDVLAAI